MAVAMAVGTLEVETFRIVDGMLIDDDVDDDAGRGERSIRLGERDQAA